MYGWKGTNWIFDLGPTGAGAIGEFCNRISLRAAKCSSELTTVQPSSPITYTVSLALACPGSFSI
jgi:hypothetical protein